MPSIAIIGCGLIGETHAECLARLGAPATLFADVNAPRAEQLANRYGARWTTDPFAACRDPEIDAVYICTYHDTHAPLAIEAARHRKQIFLEKPMAITREDCEAIRREIDRTGVRCMTGFKLHYCTLARKAKELLGTSPAGSQRPLVLAARISDRKWPEDSWANDPVRGGGNVLSQGCHAVEMLSYLAGAKPVRVYAEGGNLHHAENTITDAPLFVDAMAATIRFENAAVATLTVSDTGETPAGGKFTFQAMTGRTTVSLLDRMTMLSHWSEADAGIGDDTAPAQTLHAEEDGFLRENQEFLAALRDERDPETDHLTGYRAEMTLLAAIDAIRTGMPQQLDLP